jgi:hypothetical protein
MLGSIIEIDNFSAACYPNQAVVQGRCTLLGALFFEHGTAKQKYRPPVSGEEVRREKAWLSKFV